MREEKEMEMQKVGMNGRSGMRRQKSDVSYSGRSGFVNRRELKAMRAEVKDGCRLQHGKTESLRLMENQQ